MSGSNNYNKIILDTIRQLPIFCRVCGERLTLQDSKDMIWGCSYLGENGKKPNRTVADKHFNDSRICISFELHKGYELVESYLLKVKKKLAEEIKN